MSLERILSCMHRLGEVRFLARSRINACMSQFKETTTQLLLLVLCMSGEHVGSTNYKLQLKI